MSIQPRQPERYDTQGARVYGVSPEGPAAEAGIEEGDILVRVGNQSLVEPLPPEEEDELDPGGSLSVQRLLAVLAEAEAGERVELEYLRDGAPRMAAVVLEETVPYFFGQPGSFDFSAPAIERMGDVARERVRDVRVGVGPAFGQAISNSDACPSGAREERGGERGVRGRSALRGGARANGVERRFGRIFRS